jgi:hypothetical protein
MFQLTIRRGLLERMPLFPNRLEENPPRDPVANYHDEFVLSQLRHLRPDDVQYGGSGRSLNG